MKYQQEFLIQVENDIRPLLEEHWKEIATNQQEIKLNPDWDMYHYLEEKGFLKVFTAREEGKLVGYYVAVLSRSLHYKDHLFATNDLIFLRPEYRKGRTGIKLIQFAEKYLKEDGASVLFINTKVHKPFGRLLEYLGYTADEHTYVKCVGN